VVKVHNAGNFYLGGIELTDTAQVNCRDIPSSNQNDMMGTILWGFPDAM
jgi:hypothetical protein